MKPRPRPVRAAFAGLVALLMAALGAMGCSSLDEQQRKWIFQPTERTWGGAISASEGMQDVWIDFDSRLAESPVKLHGLWLPAERADAPVLLYLHGARWDIRSSAIRMRRLSEMGFAVLGIDYRGFGRSTNALPSESLANEDARAAWNWLRQKHPDVKGFVFGHSLGGAIAVNLVSEVDDASGLIVESTFTSIPDVFSSFKWGWLPLGPLITQRFDAAGRIGKLRVPVLVVHGGADNLIPPSLGRALYDKAPEPKRFVLVEGGTHHNANSMGLQQYRQAVTELFGVQMQ